MAETISDLAPRPRVRHLAIGVFDGVHRGHQQLLRESLSGLDSPAQAAVLTFEPHPLEVVAPQLAPPRLTLESQKVTLLRQYGLEEVVVVKFDATLQALSAEGFVAEIHRLFPSLAEVIVGPNWGFGYRRQGTVETLRQLGQGYGFTSRSLNLLQWQGAPISSTRIREAIGRRDFVLARELLGYEYGVEGRVVRGRQLGRTIGYPTANLDGVHQLMPPPGVYGGSVAWSDRRYPAILNYGRRPTLSPDAPLLLEAHLLDFSGELYDQSVRVSDFHFLREERTFPDLSALQEQLKRDEGEYRRARG